MTRISEAVECLEALGYTVTPPGAVPEIRDYKAETERLIKFAEGNGSESAATAAVATATLYLAEQQRRTAYEMQTANLIAFLAIYEERGVADDTYRLLDRSVHERLGL